MASPVLIGKLTCSGENIAPPRVLPGHPAASISRQAKSPGAFLKAGCLRAGGWSRAGEELKPADGLIGHTSRHRSRARKEYTAISIRVTRMALSLKDPETDSLARQVARLTGETLTEAVRGALRERLRNEQIKRGQQPAVDWAAIDALLARFDALPVVDTRSDDEILGYDEDGLPS
ncbi:MAG: Rv0623 family protein transcription factor [Caulobacteraceae bacterium]|jgi:antitoxin VapB|nr:Rv0623 family protein transcription factor [Caulobacteraceae bacterium]